ncbi:MAG: PspC domain-containing protein [Acidobacteriota bacterium]|nr:PspC domain-containing protein [Acidobacteriota bacterium]
MFCVQCGKDLGEGAAFCQYCGAPVAPLPYVAPKKRFARFRAEKKIAGVCSGVARHFDLDPSLVRAVWLLCVLLGGTGLLAYIILWIVMPLDPLPELPA